MIFLLGLLVTAVQPSRPQPMAGAADDTSFTITVVSGRPMRVFDDSASVSYEVSAFGGTQLAFQGVIGLQLEPTSAFRHRSLSNITRGDIFFVLCRDSALYQGEVRSLRQQEIEIGFRSITTGEMNADRENHSGAHWKQFRVLVGAVFPLASFHSSAFDDPEAGYGVTGISMGAEYMQGIAEHFEVGIVGLYSRNTIDENILIAQTIQHYPGAEISANAWDLLWLMPEIGYTTHILPVMKLYVRGMAGVMGGYAPDITRTISSVKTTLKSGSTLTMAYGGGIGIVESNRIDLSLRYIAARGEFTKGQQAGRFSTHTLQFLVGYIF